VRSLLMRGFSLELRITRDCAYFHQADQEVLT
jgi:hypothetical protein